VLFLAAHDIDMIFVNWYRKLINLITKNFISHVEKYISYPIDFYIVSSLNNKYKKRKQICK